jgi:hypothetical protein
MNKIITAILILFAVVLAIGTCCSGAHAATSAKKSVGVPGVPPVLIEAAQFEAVGNTLPASISQWTYTSMTYTAKDGKKHIRHWVRLKYVKQYKDAKKKAGIK